MSMPLSHFVPAYPSPFLCPQVHSLRLHIYSCPTPRFFRTIFSLRFHIYVLACGICFSISDLFHSVWQTLGPSTSLQITQLHSFSWLSNIPLCIGATLREDSLASCILPVLCHCVWKVASVSRGNFSPDPQQVSKPSVFCYQLTSPVLSLVRKWGKRKSLGLGREGLGSRPSSPHSSCVTLGKWPNLSELFPHWMMRKSTLPLWSLWGYTGVLAGGNCLKTPKFSLRGATALLLLLTWHLLLPSYIGGLETVQGTQRGSQCGQGTK